MSLLQYIVTALKPKIYCEKNLLIDFLNSLENYELTISSSKQEKYDIIITHNFNEYLYDNNLNYDGFYFFISKELIKYKHDYEYFDYTYFCIIKKGGYVNLEQYISTPYWLLGYDQRTEINPIILRNFGDNFNATFNVIPYCKPYEIIDHPSIIYNLCKEFNVRTYLELGVRACPVPNMISSIVDTMVGVDIHYIHDFPGRLCVMTTDEYFDMCRLKDKNGLQIYFDMIFIDACHDFEQVKKDFNNSLRYVKTGGLILLHDTYPAVEYMTDPNLCSDAYKIVDYIRKMGLQMLNLPISPGLCIVKV